MPNTIEELHDFDSFYENKRAGMTKNELRFARVLQRIALGPDSYDDRIAERGFAGEDFAPAPVYVDIACSLMRSRTTQNVYMSLSFPNRYSALQDLSAMTDSSNWDPDMSPLVFTGYNAAMEELQESLEDWHRELAWMFLEPEVK